VCISFEHNFECSEQVCREEFERSSICHHEITLSQIAVDFHFSSNKIRVARASFWRRNRLSRMGPALEWTSIPSTRYERGLRGSLRAVAICRLVDESALVRLSVDAVDDLFRDAVRYAAFPHFKTLESVFLTKT
jgi:hypothetical protein